MRLRRPQPGDMPALAALHAQSFPRPWPAGELADMARRPGAVALLAPGGDDAPPTGFILCWRMADEAEVLTLAVAPAARGTGVGRRLLEGAMRLCEEEGAVSMLLDVAADNAPALRLYAACGFAAVGRRRGYYRRPAPEAAVDALVLRRRLTGAAEPLILGSD